MRINRYVPVSLLAGILWLLPDSAVLAARLLKATVELDDKVVLRTSFGVDDTSPAAVLWRQLGDDVVWNEEGSKIDTDSADASAAKLRGLVMIRIYHVDRLLIEAKADELSLRRAGPTGDKWSIPREEVERIAQANGIPNPTLSLVRRMPIWLWMLVAGGIVIIGICVWLFLRTRRPSDRSLRN